LLLEVVSDIPFHCLLHAACTLYVTNLPDTTPEVLQAAFSAFGKVLSLTVRPKFAYIDYDPKTSNINTILQKIAANPVVVAGRTLAVQEKKSKPASGSNNTAGGARRPKGGNNAAAAEAGVDAEIASFNPEEYTSGHLLAE
jgi:RNA recognition motif-containing protein